MNAAKAMSQPVAVPHAGRACLTGPVPGRPERATEEPTGLPHSLEFCLRTLHARLTGCFARAEPRARALNYMFGLARLTDQPDRGRRNVATYTAEGRPDGAQRLLTTAQWDDMGARRTLREIARSATAEAGDFYVTEVTFVKKGNRAAGTENQFSAENGRAQNCQNAVVLLFVTASGAVFLLDTELYLPQSWLADERRRSRADIPPETGYRSKSAIAAELIFRAMGAEYRPRRVHVSLNCVDKHRLLGLLQQHRLPYLTALTATELGRLPEQAGEPGAEDRPADGPASRASWQHRPPLTVTHVSGTGAEPSRGVVAFRAGSLHALSSVEMHQLVLGQRQIEQRWRRVRERSRLDRYEVRSWRGWHRHMTLAMAVQLACELTEAVSE